MAGDAELTEREIAKAVASITGVRPHIAQHIMYMIYLERLHKITTDALSADKKLDEFSLEIPYIGILHFKVDDNCITLDSMDLKPEFVEDALFTINSGQSKLLNSLNAKFIEALNDTYKELI